MDSTSTITSALSIEHISEILRWIFTYILYPGIILGVFVYIIVSVSLIVQKGKTSTGKARRLTATLLPLIVLVFLVVSSEDKNNFIIRLIDGTSPVTEFIYGSVLGLGLMELGKYLLKTDSEVGPSIFALFLSTVGVFILYSIMLGILRNLHFPLLGLVLFGGLDIVFRGPPNVD